MFENSACFACREQACLASFTGREQPICSTLFPSTMLRVNVLQQSGTALAVLLVTM